MSPVRENDMCPVRNKPLQAAAATPLAERISNRMWYAYLIQSKKDKRWYTGCAVDLRKRFKEHNDGLVPSTKGREPFNLIYYEVCLNKDDAFARERYLKSGMGKRYLRNRLKRLLSLTGMNPVREKSLQATEVAPKAQRS